MRILPTAAFTASKRRDLATGIGTRAVSWLAMSLPAGPTGQTYEVERLLGLGARHLDIGQRDVPWVVLADLEGGELPWRLYADPSGNEFCVLPARS
jgi:hypothetical protein